MFRKLLGRSIQPRIAEAVWGQAFEQMPFLDMLDESQRKKLLDQAARFVERKTFSGADGFVVNDAVRATIALQACLPVLEIGIDAYDDFVEIIIYPDRFLAPRQRVDESGVVHEGIEELAGEAMDGGPVVLAWSDLTPIADQAGSVVIHEFIHKLDMLDGEADGTPPMAVGRRREWTKQIEDDYERFCEAVEDVEASIPIDMDPESPDADAYFADLPLDPYAATDLAEFFAVSGEAFFTDPERFKEAFPDLYSKYAEFFGFDLLSCKDPMTRAPTRGR